MTGCNTTTITLPPMASNLESECKDPMPLKDGKGETVFPVLYDSANKLFDCKDKHKATVKFYNDIRELVNGAR